jgi:glutamine amidotransferase
MRIGVVDYDAGNLKSVETALRFLQAEFFISKYPEEILKADRLIFPGVGDAAAAMRVLSETGLGEAIREYFRRGRLILGICLGSHIVLSASEEGDTACLGLIAGTARRFPKKEGFKVPHMGWNQVHPLMVHPLFRRIPETASFYFVHSFYPVPDSPSCNLASTEYILTFTSAVGRQNLCAVQFHPEKSGKFGLRLLANFLEMRETGGHGGA